MIYLSTILSALLLIHSAWGAATARLTPPTVTVKNGTYAGYHNPSYNEDYFLGIPYAQPPVGDLRFRIPLSLNSSWTGTRNATQYGSECIGYGLDTESQGNYVSEDCLTLNVIRAAGTGKNLPVGVW
jgi:carboxylesterase type B